MQDVADRVGVSKALVSLVFRKAPGPSAETRARVFAAAEELGYRVNRTAALMSARRTQLLGVTAEVRNTFHAELVEYIVSAADRAGYEVVLGAITPTHSESRVIETLLDFRCEGMILLGPVAPISELTKLSVRVPVVSVGRRLSIPTLDVVRAADSRGIAAVVDHLVDLGHRRIVYVAGGSGSIRTDRRNGYLRAMKRHGLGEHVSIIDGDFTETSGIATAETLLTAADLPTAVVAANDRMAIGVLDTMRRAGVEVPRTISVTGFDNNPLARLSHLDLTTVSQSPLEQADRAVSAVTERLDARRTEAILAVLTPRLIVGTTTARARDA
jgi:LacI family transcriptional regulator